MASGTPVVTSNVSSLPEVTGDAAVLVDPYDVGLDRRGMRRVLDDPRLADGTAAQGAAARARVLVGTLGRQDAASLSEAVADGHACRDGDWPVMSVALVHDWLTGMRGGEKVLEALCELLPRCRHLHAGPRAAARCRRPSSATAFARRSCSACRWRRRATASYLPLFPFAIEQFESRRLRPGDQLEPLRRQGGRRARARAAHLLLPFADALRVGSVRRLFRSGARRTRSRAAGCIGRCWRGWRGGTPRRRRASNRFVANSAARCRPDPPIL